MSVTPSAIKARFPEFTSETDAFIQIHLDDAVLDLDETRWGDLYAQGVAYLTAHLLVSAKRRAANTGAVPAAGAVASKSVGDVSISYASSGRVDNSVGAVEYNSTTYGQRYLTLRRMVGTGAYVV